MVKLIFIIFLCIITTNANGEEFFRRLKKTYTIKQKDNTEIKNTRTISVGLTFINIPKYKELKPDNIIYNQVLSYSKDVPFGDEHGRSTNVHETVHGINSQLRNEYKVKLKKNINVFYAGNGYAIMIENPNLTIRDIIPYIPTVIRGYRFELYFVKQLGDWNDVPTYPIDEWSAYIAGAECAVDDRLNEINIQKSDYVSGALEFSIYCTALAMATKEKNPDYWNENQQFKNMIQYFLIKAEKTFFEGYTEFPSDGQNKLLNNLKNHEDAKNLRNFLLTEFQGVFVD